MSRRLAWIAAVASACAQVARANELDDYVALQVGSFSSSEQARADSQYDAVTRHVVGRRYALRDAARFVGATLGEGCRNSYQGAAYATSQSTLTKDVMTNWDRGFDASGVQVWGPVAGPYRFRRVVE